MTRRAKAIADMSDADLIARRDALNAEIERRRIEAQQRILTLEGKLPVRVVNPRKTTPIEAPDDGRSSPAQIASNLPGPPAQEASSPGRLESARFDNDDLEIPAFMRRTGGEG